MTDNQNVRPEVIKNALEFIDEYSDTLKELADIERTEREERSNRILQRYNDYYNLECASLPHGTPITPEHQQMITLQCMIDALRCENLNREYNQIDIVDIEDLIEGLDKQATAFLERVRNL